MVATVVLPQASGEGQHSPSCAWPAPRGCGGSELQLMACSDQELPLVTHLPREAPSMGNSFWSQLQL